MSGIKSTCGLPLLLAAVVLAGSGPLAADPSGWRVGIKLGRSSFEQSFGEEQRHKSFDDRADASAVEIAYFFNEYVGVQAGYHDLGAFRGTGSSCPFDPRTCREILALFAPAAVEAEVTGWSLAVMPSWPLTPQLSAYGKLGVFGRDTELSSDVQLVDGGRDFDRVSDTDLLTGVGLHYRFGERLGALVEYERAELDAVGLGLTWSF
jgi:opacity protein-like surface antigen